MKKTFVTLACSVVLLSVANTTVAFADDVNTPDAVATTTGNSTETSIPSADSVDTGNAGTETPSTPEVPTVPSTPETPSTPEVPTVSSATEDKKDDDKKLADDKKDNTHLPIVDPTAEDTKPIETDKGTVLSTDNGKVIIKNTETGEEQTFTPEELGGKVEKDGTVTIKEKDGKLTRLPNTGLEESASMLVAGLTTLFSGVGLLKRKKD